MSFPEGLVFGEVRRIELTPLEAVDQHEMRGIWNLVIHIDLDCRNVSFGSTLSLSELQKEIKRRLSAGRG